MKNLKFLGIIVLAAVIVSLGSCAMMSSIGGTSDPLGFFTGNGAAAAVKQGATEIASYSVILGIVDMGYADYAAKVKAAEASGKKITSVTTFLFVLTKTTAYAR